ncbi:MAG: hypothetical protein H6Q99_295 [Proteobacteria bacterium]|nr:hypothetical protein [Pseudomonadota bacterium]
MDALVTKPTMNTAEVAQALGYCSRRFKNKLISLEATGFPAPLPGFTNRWSRQAVLAWINRDRSPIMAIRTTHGSNAFNLFEGA